MSQEERAALVSNGDGQPPADGAVRLSVPAEAVHVRAAATTDAFKAEHAEKPLMQALPILGAWCVTSWIMIITNKMLFNGPFAFPLTLMVCHTGLAMVATTLARVSGALTVPQAASVPRFIATVVLPIGVLFAASVGLGNLAAKEISVPFAQMLKALNPLIILVITTIMGMEPSSLPLVIVLLLLFFGVVLAATGELHFNAYGIGVQLGSCVAEAARLIATQLLLQNHLAGASPFVAVHL
jgi:hypothetical protein